MKAVFVIFDSLNRRMLKPYGGNYIETPNFSRLSQKTVTFDNHYVGSLPCMPARRDMQTGRQNFLHRSWGPMEPFDNSFPELLKKSGTYTHLISDHYHYWEDGGCNYHTRYSSWEHIRGQETDPWKVLLSTPFERLREKYHPHQNNPDEYHNIINREFIKEEQDFPSVKCFNSAFDFLMNNSAADNWLLQIETFDPHEPFTAPRRFKERYKTDYDGPILDWPVYDRVKESPAEVRELRANYFALLSLCDELLGNLLDWFDQKNMWDDTALIVTTDHGLMLSEHNWWGKSRMPVYQEIAHIPLFVHHPDHRSKAGERRTSLTQNVDLMPTFCELFGVSPPPEVIGRSMLPLLEADKSERTAAIYGYWGGGINITDGDYTYFCYPKNMKGQDLYQYTVMPTHMANMFSVDELSGAGLSAPFNFTKGVPLLRIPHKPRLDTEPHWFVFPEQVEETVTVLYDLQEDPGQMQPITDPKIIDRLNREMFRLMRELDAPKETILRFQESTGYRDDAPEAVPGVVPA
jgi:arylsulfatase A-like enzyme